MNFDELSLKLHKEKGGKLEIKSKVEIKDKNDLSIAYTPGVAEPCRKIFENEDLAYEYTSKKNMVAVISDGSAVLGLGNIGAKAAIPVMEGKAILFKEFAGVDAFPICLKSQNVEKIIETIEDISPMFGGINLEDISAPRCFEIEEELKKRLDIPVFHDDQHGTAIVVAAGLINSLKLLNKNIEEIEVVINGTGSAGIAIGKILLSLGVFNIVFCDINGALYSKSENLNWAQKEMAQITNKNDEKGLLKDVIKNKDVFIGVSAPNIVTKEMISSMNEKSIVFAMANPTPEIMPQDAKEAGAYIVGTGRSDFENQVNNVLAFPGIFKGALQVRASEINEDMKIAAVYAIANSVNEEELSKDFILPKAFNLKVAQDVAEAVSKAAIKSKVSRI